MKLAFIFHYIEQGYPHKHNVMQLTSCKEHRIFGKAIVSSSGTNVVVEWNCEFNLIVIPKSCLEL